MRYGKWLGMRALGVALIGAWGAGAALGQDGSGSGATDVVVQKVRAVESAREPFDSDKEPRLIALRECIQMALRANLELKVEAFNPPIALEDIRGARSVFDPAFFSNASHTFRRFDTTPTSTSTSTATALGSGTSGRPRSDYTETSTLHYDLGVRKRTITGASVELKWSQDRSRDDPQRLDSRDPRYTNAVSLSVTQPLLRGAGPEFNSIDTLVAESTRDATVYQLQRTIIDVVTRTELRYLDLNLARENLVTAVKSYNVAVELYENSVVRVSVGDKKLVLLESRTVVESRREQLVVVRNAIRDAEDALKNLIAPQDAELRDRIELVPSENVDVRRLEGEAVDFNRARAMALAQRPELASIRNQLNTRHLQVLKARNGLLPQLNATSALTFDGIGGSHHDSVNNTGEFRYLSWSVGLGLEIPLGNRAAKASYDKSRLQYAQTATDYERLEADVVFEVRRAVRAIATAKERYLVAQTSEEISRELLDAKESERIQGTVTVFEYNQTSEDYIRARNNTARAKTEYVQAFTRLRQAESSTLSYLERLGVLVIPVSHDD